MHDKPKPITFENSQNPEAWFDFVEMQEIFTKQNLSHSPYEFHMLEFYAIIIIEQGEGVHSIDFTEFEYKSGTVFTVRKGQVHKFHDNEFVKGSVLIFTHEFMVSYLDELEALKSLQLFNECLSQPVMHLNDLESNIIKGIISRLQTEYFAINDKYSQEIIRSELHILTTKLFRIKSQNDQEVYKRKYLKEFQQLVESNANKTQKVNDYAEMMDVSIKTLNNIAKDIVNIGAKDFIDDICIKQIKRLLINTKLTIKEIAFTLGFEETTNFYKYFKHRTVNTPEQFRSSL